MQPRSSASGVNSIAAQETFSRQNPIKSMAARVGTRSDCKFTTFFCKELGHKSSHMAPTNPDDAKHNARYLCPTQVIFFVWSMVGGLTPAEMNKCCSCSLQANIRLKRRAPKRTKLTAFVFLLHLGPFKKKS